MSAQVTEKSAGSHLKLPALPTMMLVPMYCLVNAEEPQQDVYPLSTQQDEPDDIQSNTSSWDEDLSCTIWEAYDHPKSFFQIEQGLHMRISPMPALDDCFVEEDAGYRKFGTIPRDWHAVTNSLNKPLVIVDVDAWALFVCKPGEEEMFMDNMKTCAQAFFFEEHASLGKLRKQ